MTDFVCDPGWNKPLAVSHDLMLVVQQWPQYLPRRDRDDRVEWSLTTSKEYTLKSAWNAIRMSR